MQADRLDNLNPTCVNVRRDLLAYIDADLSGADANRVRLHLDLCGDCAHELDELRYAESALRMGRESLSACGDLRAAFYIRLAAANRRRPWQTGMRMLSLALPIAATAAVTMLLLRTTSAPIVALRPNSGDVRVATTVRPSTPARAANANVIHSAQRAHRYVVAQNEQPAVTRRFAAHHRRRHNLTTSPQFVARADRWPSIVPAAVAAYAAEQSQPGHEIETAMLTHSDEGEASINVCDDDREFASSGNHNRDANNTEVVEVKSLPAGPIITLH